MMDTNTTTITFQRVPVMENLGLALLGVGCAVIAEQYWKADEQRLRAVVEHWRLRLKDTTLDWPPEVHEARRAYEAVRSHVWEILLVPVVMYIMRREVFAVTNEELDSIMRREVKP